MGFENADDGSKGRYSKRTPVPDEISVLDLHRALSDWDEADPVMQTYLRTRKDLVLALAILEEDAGNPFHWQKAGKQYPWDE